MKILENKIVCIILMVILIAGGFLLGGYKGLAGQYQKAEKVFFLGEDGDGICVANDMAERASCLTNMQTVAKKYLPKSDSALKSASASLNDYTQAEGDIRALFVANSGMDSATRNTAKGFMRTSIRVTTQSAMTRTINMRRIIMRY